METVLGQLEMTCLRKIERFWLTCLRKHAIAGLSSMLQAARIHAYMIGHLEKKMPTMMGKAKAQQWLIDNLQDGITKV